MAIKRQRSTTAEWAVAGLAGAAAVYAYAKYKYSQCNVKLLHAENTVAIVDNRDESGKKKTLIDIMNEGCPSLTDSGKAFFYPTPYLWSGHLQTVFNTFMAKKNKPGDVKYERELLHMKDGGNVALDWAPSFESVPKDDRPIVIILHGLTGGSHEYYVRAVAKKFTSDDFNFRVVVANFRGCGRSKLTSSQLYSGGYTDDIRQIVKEVHSRFPNSSLFGIGFSLGSNVLVKYVGQEGENCLLSGAISVCNPFDFVKAAENMEKPTWANRNLYQPNLTGALQRMYFRHKDSIDGSKFGIVEEEIKNAKKISEYDDALTAKVFGFESCWDYYRDASSGQYISKVRVPLLCVNALDDPISPKDCIPYHDIENNPYVVLATTDYGGHLGWFTSGSPTPWYPQPFAEFFAALAKYDNRRQTQKA
ncbi:hypothetical protein H4219_000649 [Mycoemilia scoparia]|uniref:AB hydrolase-1 domain-containing protein n=1 Tax=Mycoemilia scoparia TaxID=417184 RepID=A0A9W8A257_9FUNG|nr:hypothetical protein H4219_000649 [Mycoemilia scoparia]